MAELGIHKARAIRGSEQAGVDSKGNLRLAVDMALSDGSGAVTVTFSFAGAAPEWSIKKLRMLGWVGDDIDNLKGIDTNEVEVRIYEEVFEGKPQRKADIVFGGGTFKFEKQLDDREKRSFAAQFRNLAKTIPAARGSETRRATGTDGAAPRERQPGEDDDIAF